MLNDLIGQISLGPFGNLMPFGNFTTDHNMALSQVASGFCMNSRSRYTDAILLADYDVPTLLPHDVHLELYNRLELVFDDQL